MAPVNYEKLEIPDKSVIPDLEVILPLSLISVILALLGSFAILLKAASNFA